MQRSRPPIKQKEDDKAVIDQVEQATAQLKKNEFFQFFCDFVLGEEEAKKQYQTDSMESLVEVIDQAESDTSL